MLEVETNNECTILDYLNEDCWRAVLRFVPVRDIVQSECVSRRWQQVVLAYLQGIRFRFWGKREDKVNNSPLNAYNWPLRISMYESFVNWIDKLGSRVVATYCTNQEHLKIIRENCPNLEALALINFVDKAINNNLTQNFHEDFRSLKQLSLNTCLISDHRVSPYAAHKALEELEFTDCPDLTGQCLASANLPNIKSLMFDSCLDLQASYVVSSTNQLCQLTKLRLLGVPNEILKEILLVLDRMPKLEQLELYTHARANLPLENYEPLCQLNHLKQLSTNLQVTDISVGAITGCCKKLHTIELENCDALNIQGLKAICKNSGQRLKELVLVSLHCLKDHDVVDAVRRCPKLTILLVGGFCEITPALPALVSAALHEVSPGHVLRLDLCNSHLTDPYYQERDDYLELLEEYENLVVVLEPK